MNFCMKITKLNIYLFGTTKWLFVCIEAHDKHTSKFKFNLQLICHEQNKFILIIGQDFFDKTKRKHLSSFRIKKSFKKVLTEGKMFLHSSREINREKLLREFGVLWCANECTLWMVLFFFVFPVCRTLCVLTAFVLRTHLIILLWKLQKTR